ncbi:7 transmembrane receptor [Trichuris trichiura]|uniref:7 transmembrane receptor n=1 Tax=Trichuris trichiura TaxID=36087 RepID=A0A077YZK8_TRITR|nr:7 transmembrane receptor [Trichuris trichiura]
MSRQEVAIYEQVCSQKLDNVSDERYLVGLTMEAKFFAFVLPVITGILLNVLILAIVLCCRAFHFKQHLFLCNIAFADLLLAAICGIINMDVEGLMNSSHGARTWSICALMAFAEMSAQAVMVFGQACASFERFLVIVLPFQAHRLWTRETSGGIILICWLAAFFVGTLGPILVDRQCIEFTDTRRGHHIWYYCGVRDGYRLTLSKVRLIFLFSIPFALMMVFYGTVCWRLWRTCTQYGVTQFSRLSYHSSIESRRSIAERLLAPRQRMSNSSNRFGVVGVIESRRRVIKMLIMVLLVFFVCWSPKLVFDVKNAECADSGCTTGVNEWPIDLDTARLFAGVLVLYYPTISALLFLVTAPKVREKCKFLILRSKQRRPLPF